MGKTERRPYRESFHSAVRNTCAEAVPHLTREMRAAAKRTWRGAETRVSGHQMQYVITPNNSLEGRGGRRLLQ